MSDRTPDLSFKAGFGFYLGIIAAGVVALGSVAAGAGTETILVTTPSTVVAALLFSLVFGDRLGDLPERLGTSRRRRLAWYLPSLGFGASVIAPAMGVLQSTGRFSLTAGLFTVLSGAVTLGVSQMARHRHIDAVTPDEPVVTWQWRRPSFKSGFQGAILLGFTILTVVFGLGSLLVGDGSSAWVLIYALIPAFMWLSDRYNWGWNIWEEPNADSQWGMTTLEAYENGLLVDNFERRLVSWNRVGEIRLTDDELIIERHRWFDVRCDRSVIDDPESLRATLVRLRDGEGRDAYDQWSEHDVDADAASESESASELEPESESTFGSESGSVLESDHERGPDKSGHEAEPKPGPDRSRSQSDATDPELDPN
ncbi:uncharacterized protein Nmag_2716 [Natrialba magadii ATCC 43099]|uniref:Uncharacterized protein n=1 Tax=Natrialba magadii (strain ATCC 43099 / DSM 3394 / CCM 3739 / CIP 104546 / IAM 13178 / JCM 8861 / NBRC 102185 / NCIMB 2190 / MS3) TaxID=547559 RepID=D3SZ80_NATMM|nr:hypothetical protein [Natrialba magadii]ADD06272.1 uncharacterized protein Nmag_2716 [Natrialba magadii ATCC 43099]ELY31294.1 hypothetical protein C500_06821 [Natrialba magadii ATCC 43099]